MNDGKLQRELFPLNRGWLGQTWDIEISLENYAFVGNAINGVKEKKGLLI